MFSSAIICGKPPLATNCTQKRFHGESMTSFLPENEASRVKQKLNFSGFSFVCISRVHAQEGNPRATSSYNGHIEYSSRNCKHLIMTEKNGSFWRVLIEGKFV